MAEHLRDSHGNDENVMTALYGPWKPAAVGHVRDERQGLIHKVEQLWQAAPGGPRKLKGSDRFALWATAAAVIADRLAELII